MATFSRTAPAARLAVHLLFPPWRRTLVALAIEVITLLLHLPLPAHVLVAVVTHLAVACWPRPPRG